MYESRIEVDEYNALKDYYSELNRFYSSTNTRKQRVSIPSALLSAMPSLGSINNSFSSKRSSSIYSNGPDFPEFISTAAFSAPDPETEVKPEYKTTSTLSQMFNQLYSQHQLIKNLAPLRIKLRTRVSRKCRECDTCILKPDSKTKSIDFIVNCAARNYFPDISIIDPLPVFKPDTHSILVLSFRFLESVDVSLQVEDCSGCLVDLLVKKFKIANNEFVNEPVEGIFEARNKYTSILVDVKPIFIDGSARIKFTLAVTCSKTKSIGNFVIDMGEISST